MYFAAPLTEMHGAQTDMPACPVMKRICSTQNRSGSLSPMLTTVASFMRAYLPAGMGRRERDRAMRPRSAMLPALCCCRSRAGVSRTWAAGSSRCAALIVGRRVPSKAITGLVIGFLPIFMQNISSPMPSARCTDGRKTTQTRRTAARCLTRKHRSTAKDCMHSGLWLASISRNCGILWRESDCRRIDSSPRFARNVAKQPHELPLTRG